MSSSSKSPQHPDNFYRTELEQALSEQVFGVARGDVIRSTPEDAAALITLLEGPDIEVGLSSAGYTISGRGDVRQAKYETLDDLLVATSPLYAAKRMEVLFAKLQEIAQ
ncbi:hypothetical protein FA95DRAFT_1489595 [Auriscalpium vulgare]|uniref:Uncharacterized protein n=1 Tax=Auriscalpium vulgare TaxID=40419 RepID=A0ACB8S0A0_9AGAM|nr:hypothetical protein FA95DRAFT_1489595 [Auriscalpium vulgare]